MCRININSGDWNLRLRMVHNPTKRGVSLRRLQHVKTPASHRKCYCSQSQLPGHQNGISCVVMTRGRRCRTEGHEAGQQQLPPLHGGRGARGARQQRRRLQAAVLQQRRRQMHRRQPQVPQHARHLRCSATWVGSGPKLMTTSDHEYY